MLYNGDDFSRQANASVFDGLRDAAEIQPLVSSSNGLNRGDEEKDNRGYSSSSEYSDFVEDRIDYVGSPRTSWIALEGFQVASKLCIHYCEPAIPKHVIRLVAAVEMLLQKEVDDASHTEIQEIQVSSFNKYDAAELLIRLCVRKNTGFLLSRLEEQYGSEMKVLQALKTLEGRTILTSKVSGWNGAIGSAKRSRDGEIDTASEGYWEPMCTAFKGSSIAANLFNPCRTSSCLLNIIFNASKAVQLRRVALEMHRAAELILLSRDEKSNISVGVPTRKEDIITYLTHFSRRILIHTHWSEEERKSVENVFVRSWEQHVGKVYVISEELRYAIQYVARLFHVLTSNFYASHIFKDPIRRSSVVAHVPGSVLYSFQRAVLFNWRREIYDPLIPSDTDRLQWTSTSSPSSRDVPNLEWFIPCDQIHWKLQGQSPLRIKIFESEEEINLYWMALRLHERVFNITDGAVNFAKKLLGRDESHVMSIYSGAVELLQLLRGSMSGTCGTHSENTLGGYLCREGLAACHLLQFTPQYRVFACLELVYPLLESLRKYQEAIECLHILLGPLFTIYPCEFSLSVSDKAPHHFCRPRRHPPTAAGATSFHEKPDSSFSLYYRSEKRGEWWYRLGMNYSHLDKVSEALRLFSAVHERWKELFSLNSEDREVLLQMTTPFMARSTATSSSQNLQQKNTHAYFISISRRARMLRAIWNNRGTDSKAMWHAAMEFVLSRYCRHGDLICIEKSIQTLHKKLYKWKPVSDKLQTALGLLRKPTELKVLGRRDDNNTKGWRDPSRGNASSSSVEGMVLHHFLNTLNKKDKEDDSIKSSWDGLHCEGRWIAYLSRVLLWEVFYWDGNANNDASRKPNGIRFPTFLEGEHHIWLSKFQDGPLDALNPILFAQHRRQLIEERIRFLETLSDAEFLQTIAERCIEPGANDSQIDENNRITDVACSEILKGDELQCAMEEDLEQGTERPTDGVRLSILAPFKRVKLNGFPLLELAAAIPRTPLMQLLRCMFVDFIFDGLSSSHSGFPDLIFWRMMDKNKATVPPSSRERASDKTFLLMEVKSPSDELSMKQIAVNDCLLRCGFHVNVVRVKDIDKSSSRGK